MTSPLVAAESALARQLPELQAGQSVALLQALHILTREGRINQDSRRKLKQVMHLVQFIAPLLTACAADAGPGATDRPTLVDHGAGKSYLGFLLYDLVIRPLGRGQVIGVEARAPLVASSTALAERLGFDRMRFLAARVAELDARVPDAFQGSPIDVVTALHACDTATDDAIEFAVAHRAKHLVIVPCCQAELARAMSVTKALSLARTPLAELWRHPLHTRELGSHLTNVLRCLYLEALGYRVRVTELVGWEHSLKNELIIADLGAIKTSSARRLQAIAAELGLETWARQRFPRIDWEGSEPRE